MSLFPLVTYKEDMVKDNSYYKSRYVCARRYY